MLKGIAERSTGKSYACICFVDWDKDSAQFELSYMQVQRNPFGGSCFKLLEDVPLSHDGLGFSFCFYFHRGHLCSIFEHGGFKSFNTIGDHCMLSALLQFPWCQIFSFRLAAPFVGF